MTQTAWIVSIGAALYVAALLAISITASRRVKGAADFLIAGRQLPLGIAIFTIFATWFGSGTLIGAAAAAYQGGLSAVLANPFGSALCLLLTGLFYAKLLRRMRLMTLPDLFRDNFGRKAEILASICIVPAYIGWVGSILVAFGTIVNVVTGVSFEVAVLGAAAVTIAYTYYGGLWAVSLTDLLQAIIVIAGLLFLLPLIIDDLGGWQSFLERAPDTHFDMTPEPGLYGWLMFYQGLLVIGFGNIASQDLLQRVFSARNERVAQHSMLIATALYLSIGIIPVLIGIAGAIVLPDLENAASVMPEMGLKYLPPLGMALFVGAMFSALVSSADGGMLAPAGIIAKNIFNKSEEGSDSVLRVSRISVLAIGLLGIATALYFQSVYALMVKSFSILMVGLFVPMTAALYWRRVHRHGVLTGMIAGIASWLALEYANAQLFEVAWPAELTAAGVNLILMVTISLFKTRTS